MQLEGIHHITAITGDAPGNLDFYVRVLGLRLVKKTVNQDDPTVYHLFYADTDGSPGADLTFFEYPGAVRGRAGDGMVHRIVWRVASPEALEFWEQRLAGEGIVAEREPGSLRFEDPEGLALELTVGDAPDKPLTGDSPEVPREFALQGFDAVRAYAARPSSSDPLLAELGFVRPPAAADGYEIRGRERGGRYFYDEPPAEPGVPGAGTVHHVAFASVLGEEEAWRERVQRAGARPTPVIDRFYFRSVYFREPSGVLFEIATIGPGFAVDEPAGELGEHLALPPRFEPLRARIEQTLTPLPTVAAPRG